MKKLIVALVVLTTLVSCGKANKIDGVAVGINGITVDDTQGVSLGQKIDNYTTQFGHGQVMYYGYPQTWGFLVNSGLALKFKYTESTSTTSGNGQTCEKKWGIFYVCTYTTSSSTLTTLPISRTVLSNGVNVASKIAELKDIINRKNPVIPVQVSGTSYYIKTTDGRDHVIDTRYPLQANPIGVKTAEKTEYLFNITE